MTTTLTIARAQVEAAYTAAKGAQNLLAGPGLVTYAAGCNQLLAETPYATLVRNHNAEADTLLDDADAMLLRLKELTKAAKATTDEVEALDLASQATRIYELHASVCAKVRLLVSTVIRLEKESRDDKSPAADLARTLNATFGK